MIEYYQNDRLFFNFYFAKNGWNALQAKVLSMSVIYGTPFGNYCAKQMDYKMRKQSISIYKQAERFAAVTKTMLVTGNIDRAKKCFLIAEDLLQIGTTETKIAISNIFLYSVSSFMELNHLNAKSFFPPNLEREYISQINASSV